MKILELFSSGPEYFVLSKTFIKRLGINPGKCKSIPFKKAFIRLIPNHPLAPVIKTLFINLDRNLFDNFFLILLFDIFYKEYSFRILEHQDLFP